MLTKNARCPNRRARKPREVEGVLSFGSAEKNCPLKTGPHTGIALQAVGRLKWRTYVVVEQSRAIFPLVNILYRTAPCSISRDVAFWGQKRGRQTRLYMSEQGLQLVAVFS